MPRLGRAPGPHTAEQRAAAGLDRHPSMAEMSLRTLMWNPALQDAYAGFSRALHAAARLPVRDREIAILRHAWDCGADYQWGMHAESARAAGLTSAEIEALTRDDGDWAEHERAIIAAVDELHAASRIGDQAWATLAGHYDEGQLIELLMVVGSYRLLAYIQGSVGIRPPAGTSPDLPGNTFTFPA
jgi:4-carboxymuconolactone decarboxylase